jgi:hypothetical protein
MNLNRAALEERILKIAKANIPPSFFDKKQTAEELTEVAQDLRPLCGRRPFDRIAYWHDYMCEPRDKLLMTSELMK